MTRDERREFVLNSGLLAGDTTDLDGAVDTYFTGANFNAMFGADWAEIRAEARGMIADRGER